MWAPHCTKLHGEVRKIQDRSAAVGEAGNASEAALPEQVSTVRGLGGHSGRPQKTQQPDAKPVS